MPVEKDSFLEPSSGSPSRPVIGNGTDTNAAIVRFHRYRVGVAWVWDADHDPVAHRAKS
jgi:hypothetical protein